MRHVFILTISSVLKMEVFSDVDILFVSQLETAEHLHPKRIGFSLAAFTSLNLHFAHYQQFFLFKSLTKSLDQVFLFGHTDSS